ncbi:hypothetical protein [Bradyrhizobium lablabi]|uniref:hypothetical protein n=1 Tax=Bradyrhizobium lablabi TaxID=722472 RepID=UPI0012E3C466|nr:hypothetical protein [Bradyrhizobium lablabi]
MRFVVPLVWKSKWLIAAAAVLAATVTFALMSSDKIEAWSGRANLTIGLAPASDFLAQKSGPAVAPIETPRRTIARLSDPAFRELIVKRAVFEPATASISRSMVASSLRGIALDKERDVAIELTAGSAADVQSAFRAVAAEVGAAHAAILDRQLDVVESRINEVKLRIAAIEKEIDEVNERLLKPLPPPRRNESQRSLISPMLVTTISAWNELQSLVRNDTILKQLSEQTALRVEADHVVVTHRSIERLRTSLLAGAGMLVAMIILTIVVNPPTRASGRLGKIDLTER